ncbi:MAG: nucleotidyl transferase AbiEii/AbiGii toxin family protein, partial [Chloroflexi bacterium]|nr:nucleotidyl transferase AbiEii/AbiGii toxin family protein [Chloroflexota bacterium]
MAFMDILREQAERDGLPLRVILKEALQVYVLAAVYALPASERVTFQGDTCLRLVYGGPRYSEDLDFVTTLTSSELQRLFEDVQSEVMRLAPLFEGAISLRVQKATAEMVRWKVYYRRNSPRDATSVSVEFAPYPAYTSRVVPLHLPFPLPALPLVVVRAETEAEILADKVAAFAGRRYVKGRDVFDIWWLRQRGIEVDRDMV